ncbi:MAG: LVIVD repeat-containing protein, partial [Candidatus Binatia bacterium]
MKVEEIQAKSESRNVRLVAHHDLDGHGDGMQLLKHGRYVYIAHLGTSPMALTIVDAADPADPRVVNQMPHPSNTHARKVQIAGDILIQNQERPYFDKTLSASVPNEAGIRIYSIAEPAAPREIGYMRIPGKGVHRMWFTDGKYAHVGAMLPGIKERAYLIADISNPSNPKEAGRWWIPGTKEGEET